MAMTNKEFSSHFSDTFTPEIKAFGRETLLKEGFDCLIVTDKEDKEKAYCTHCKKWVKIPGDTIHTGSPKSIQAAERREYNRHCCHGAWGMTEGDIELEKADEERRLAIKRRKYALCPECGHTFNVYHQWRMDMSQLDGTVSISIWAKSKVEPGAVVMRRIEIERNYGNGDEPVVKDTYKEAERYLFRMGKKTVRQNCNPKGHWGYDENKGWYLKKPGKYRSFIKSIIDRAVRQSTVMWSDYVKGHYRMNIASLKTAIRNTPYQYLFTGKSNYIRNYEHYPYRESYPLYTVNLMDLYSLHPWVELLLKNGMENIVMDHVRKIGHSGAICWGAKSIKSAVKHFTKQDMKDILAINSGQELVTEEHLSILAEARKLKMQLTVRNAIQIEKRGGGLTEMIFEARRLHLRPEYVLEYCMREGGIGNAIADWLDYIADAGRVGLDLEDRTNSMPKNLLKRHANIIRQIKYREDKELEEKLKETLALRDKIFNWKDKKYIIRPAASTEELIAEGKALHHCVGGYAERHAKGETTILFVRTNKAPDKPLYTMEVKGGPKSGWKLVQIRGSMNEDPPEEVRMMVRNFLEQVNAKGSKRKVRKTA